MAAALKQKRQGPAVTVCATHWVLSPNWVHLLGFLYFPKILVITF